MILTIIFLSWIVEFVINRKIFLSFVSIIQDRGFSSNFLTISKTQLHKLLWYF